MNPRWIRKTHRWLGVIAAFWLVLLAVSGVLLQHAEDWGLDKKPVRSAWLLSLHGLTPTTWAYDPVSGSESDPVKIQQFGQRIFRLPVGNRQWLDLPEQPLAVFSAGKSPDNQHLWLVFSSEIWQLRPTGELINQWDAFDGLPTPIESISLDNNALILDTSDGSFAFDLVTGYLAEAPLAADPSHNRHASRPPAPKKFPGALVNSHISKNLLSWQKVIFSWHAGLLGTWWLNDLAAAALVFLSISGFWLFMRRNRNSRNPRKNRG